MCPIVVGLRRVHLTPIAVLSDGWASVWSILSRGEHKPRHGPQSGGVRARGERSFWPSSNREDLRGTGDRSIGPHATLEMPVRWGRQGANSIASGRGIPRPTPIFRCPLGTAVRSTTYDAHPRAERPHLARSLPLNPRPTAASQR